jgi:NADH-quinone oxidoreductase subunit E
VIKITVETATLQKLEPIFSRHKRRREDLIPILQEAQAEFRYLPPEVLEAIADFLGLSASAVYGVSTFYAQFKFTPVGKHTVRLCRGTACHVRGAARIQEETEKQLGIKPGETTEDMEYSLETTACFGSCALAPVMVVDDDVYGRMTPARVREILGKKG